MMDEGSHGPETSAPVKKPRSKLEIGCLLVFLGFFGFLLLAYGPGFLAYQEQKKRHSAKLYLETIRSSLKIYSEEQPDKSFPAEMNSYEDITEIVNDAGKSIPSNQADAEIESFQYETEDQKSFILYIKIEDNDRHFFVVYPDSIIEGIRYDPIDTESAMELVRTLLYMDRALIERDPAGYLGYYSSKATIGVEHTTYKGRVRFEKNVVKSIVYEELDSYSRSLMDAYSNRFPKYRKREDIFIEKSGENWEVHSGYIEEGTIQERKYREEGRTKYEVSPSKRPDCVLRDDSFAFVHLLED
jgi:hypothetical protein